MGLSHREIKQRNIKILGDKFIGLTVQEISKKYKITSARVYQILKGEQSEA